jgi:signal transduction histidine kinase
MEDQSYSRTKTAESWGLGTSSRPNQRFFEDGISDLTNAHSKLSKQLAKTNDNINLASIEIMRELSRSGEVTSRSLQSLVSLKYSFGQHAKVLSLKLLPKFLINLPYFSSFDTCQILLHSKGSPHATSFAFTRMGGGVTSNIDADQFKKFFSSIKKSRKRIFSNIGNKDDNLDFVGTYMAREHALKGHDFILVLSRNDFLSPSEDEVQAFEAFNGFLRPIFDYLADKEQTGSKIESIVAALELLPFPIWAKDEHGTILFQNEISHTFDGQSREAQTISTIEVRSGIHLSYIPPDSSTIAGDLFHHQRMSLLGELLNTLQHELSNPLFGIGLTSKALSEEIDDPESIETLLDIYEASNRCQTIIKEFSVLYASNDSPVEILISKTIREVIVLSKSELRGITRHLDLDPKLEEIKITTHPTWLTQILFNLIINSAQAIRSSDKSDASLRIRAKLNLVSESIDIDVIDTGPGIPPEVLDKIFVPFFTTKSSGTGLGLSICQGLARKLGYQLKSIPNPEGGQIFSLQIPMPGSGQ